VVRAFRADDPAEVFGINTLEELAEAGRRLRRRRIRDLLAAGVTIEDPDSVHVGPDVEIAAEATIRPFTVLEGRTRVASGACIGPFVRLSDVVVGAEAVILDHCLLRECVVGAGASVGPSAHVRPATEIGARAKVGNFVELKKTRLGEGSKAPHLSYLGDSTIGAGVNVGAGTITCNYDGRDKHPTQIEDGVFVGSNSTLVAPLTIRQGAYVAAGSVVTKEVPAESLVLGRARQVVKDGWARRRRQAQSGQKKP
jgi:bifunctional UDP-N-acetylglucosamine pyrophosphorylase/glucosamine-1-phosphate N-acetyltransferase